MIMARSRNIKPGFFQNEQLGELEPIARLAFIGMWTVADFKGCLEFRPKRLKIQLLPYDDCDLEKIAINLDKSGLIRMYSVQGNRYIKILKFEEHQNPHKNERDAGSEIPDFDENNREINDLEKIENNREQDGTNRADSLLLIPDSLLLNPESTPQTPSGLNPTLKKGAISLKTFIDECKEKNERPLRDYKSLWEYTEKVGLSEDFVALAWAEFLRRFMPGGSQQEKRQKDWRCTFRKYIENNYFKLWAIDQNGNYFLTTIGKQAERFQGEE